MSSIKELGSASSNQQQQPTSRKRTFSTYIKDMESNDEDDEDEGTERPTYNHENYYPVVVIPYASDDDNVREIDEVVVIVQLPSDVTNIQLSIANDGETAVVNYVWPETLYSKASLLGGEIINSGNACGGVSKVMAINQFLSDIKDKTGPPQGKVVIKLPFRVETSDHLIKRELQKRDMFNANGAVVNLFTQVRFTLKKRLD